jgi:hypothetical protein
VLQLLFWAAVFAGLAKLIYEMACPAYLKFADSFSRFAHARPFSRTTLADDFRRL